MSYDNVYPKQQNNFKIFSLKSRCIRKNVPVAKNRMRNYVIVNKSTNKNANQKELKLQIHFLENNPIKSFITHKSWHSSLESTTKSSRRNREMQNRKNWIKKMKWNPTDPNYSKNNFIYFCCLQNSFLVNYKTQISIFGMITFYGRLVCLENKTCTFCCTLAWDFFFLLLFVCVLFLTVIFCHWLRNLLLDGFFIISALQCCL